MDYKQGMEPELEILVATMNRNSLGFLDSMFVNNDISKLHILVVNQTTEDCLLTSLKPNIRVVNSFEKGLSRSRNLAIKNAIGEICLLADDDVVYVEGFAEKIVNSFNRNRNFDLITFKTLTTVGSPYWKYPESNSDIKSVYRKILSIEIAFRKQTILDKNIKFDEQFGLGGIFEDGENVFFLQSIFENEVGTQFVPEFIVIHKAISSSDDVTSDRHFFARGAMNYKLHGIWAYFLIMKLIVSLLKKRLISFSDVCDKMTIGLKGIKKYKEINMH